MKSFFASASKSKTSTGKVLTSSSVGLAYNCIGVDYQLLSSEQPHLLEKAIKFHKLHEDVADINGKFIASINLGLCHDND